MGFGGPVWHVSVCPQGRRISTRKLALLAHSELFTVGSIASGEWAERTEVALHLRRRLSEREQAIIDPPVLDVRGTEEATIRAARAYAELPAGQVKDHWRQILRAELGEPVAK